MSFRGQDVTKKGTLVRNDATITWTADRAVYEDVNANFGPKSSAKPVFTMTFDADIKQASNADEALRFNAKVGKVVIETMQVRQLLMYSVMLRQVQIHLM